MISELRSIIEKIPNGPLWVTGQSLKEWFGAFLRDRMKVAAGGGLREDPVSDGRALSIDFDANTIPIRCYVEDESGGTVETIDVIGRSRGDG
jgi:hypothetical protein